MSDTPTTTRERQSPADAARTQQASDIGAAKRAARAKRQAETETPTKHQAGQIVEIAGPAKVDASDSIGTERTDHQGAVAQVEGHYYSPERGQQMARVRTEDNKVRVIPEERLRDISEDVTTEGTEEGRNRVGPLGISQDRFDEIFGKKDRSPHGRDSKQSDE